MIVPAQSPLKRCGCGSKNIEQEEVEENGRARERVDIRIVVDEKERHEEEDGAMSRRSI